MEFSVGTANYRTAPMDAFRQWHVMRRIGAAVTGDVIEVANRLIDLRKKMANGSGENWLVNMAMQTDFVDIIPLIEPLIRALGKMSDEESNYVIMACLSVVSRQVPGGVGWAPVVAGDRMMYADITMPEMIQIVGYVLRDNLQSFFGALPSSGPGTGQQPSGPGFQAAKTG